MPHLIIEHNQTVNKNLNISRLTKSLHQILAKQESIKLESIKSRSIVIDDCLIGDSETKPDFIHVTLKLLAGRSDELKNSIGQSLQEEIFNEFQKAKRSRTTASITLEIRDLETYFK